MCRRIVSAVPALTLALLCSISAIAAAAEPSEARVAVAANFREAAVDIGLEFERATSHRVDFSFGSTGQLYAQIVQGAPFDVFLAADQIRPGEVVEQGLAVDGSQFTYTVGRLVLYSADPAFVTGPHTLADRRFLKLAIAEPALAPYGSAALEALRSLRRYEQVRDRIIRGLNIAQAFQFVHTGNAELGFVALSQVARLASGSSWVVPEELHSPIAQDAVLLERGRDNPAAEAFCEFLGGSAADAILAKYGYERGK